MLGLNNQYSCNIWNSNNVSQLEFSSPINWQSSKLTLKENVSPEGTPKLAN